MNPLFFFTYPCVCRVTFTDSQSSETFRVSLGIGPVAALARHLSIAPSPENWTLGQRRRLIKSAIRERSTLVPVEEEEEGEEEGEGEGEDDGSSYRRRIAARKRHRAIGRSLFVVRCAQRLLFARTCGSHHISSLSLRIAVWSWMG